MSTYGRAARRLTLWLGTETGEPDSMLPGGTGYEASREDGMVLVTAVSEDETTEVFLLEGLFPAIEAALDACYARQGQALRRRAGNLRAEIRAALEDFDDLEGDITDEAAREAALTLATLLEDLLDEEAPAHEHGGHGRVPARHPGGGDDGRPGARDRLPDAC